MYYRESQSQKLSFERLIISLIPEESGQEKKGEGKT